MGLASQQVSIAQADQFSVDKGAVFQKNIGQQAPIPVAFLLCQFEDEASTQNQAPI
jgi:hypothetical protein